MKSWISVVLLQTDHGFSVMMRKDDGRGFTAAEVDIGHAALHSPDTCRRLLQQAWETGTSCKARNVVDTDWLWMGLSGREMVAMGLTS